MKLKPSPRLVLLTSLGVVSALLSAFFTGENRDFVADKKLLQRSFQKWLPVSSDDLSFFNFYTDGHPQSVVDSYGYSFHYFSYLASRIVGFLTGGEFRAIGGVSLNTQNVILALIGVLGCWAVGLVCREIFQSTHAELAGIVGTFLLPLWLGHSWTNQKDVPFAVGFACATAAATIAASISGGRTFSRSLSRELTISLTLAVLLTFGTRPGIAVLVLPPLLYVFLALRKQSAKVQLRLGVSVLGGAAIVLVTNPASIPNPIGWVWNSISTGRNFIGYAGDVLFEGRFVRSQDLGWRYIVSSFVSSLPLVAILGLIAGVIFLITRIRQGELWKVLPIAYHALVAAALVLGISSNNYNAGRQFLFVVIGWQMVSILGLWWLGNLSATRWRQASRIVIAGLVAVLMIDHVSIFPYQYVYRNEISRQADNLAMRGEYDYWALASRELVRAIPDEPGLVIYFGSGDLLNGGRYLTQNGQPLVPENQVVFDESAGASWKSETGQLQFDYVPWLHYWPPELDYVFRTSLEGCQIVHSAYARFFPARVLLGVLYKCR